ncbi:MAG: hypothetical protein ACXW4B_06110 [Micavibrio sp.]
MTISDLQRLYQQYRRIFIGLSVFLLTVLLFGTVFFQQSAYEAKASTYDPGWIKCAHDQTCTALRGACGEWMPVNMDSVENAAAYYKRLATKIECVRTIDTPDKPAILCLHEQCTFGVRAIE